MRILRNLCFLALIGWIIVLFTTPIYPDIKEIGLYQNIFFLPNQIPLIFIKIFKILVFAFATLFFYLWTKKIINKKTALLSTLIFIILPWNIYLFSFHIISAIILMFFLLILLVQASTKILSKNKIKLIIVFVILIILNIGFIKNVFLAPENFLSEIKFEQVALVIDEEIKIQFLSVNKTFLTPKIARKIMYNYPIITILKLTEKSISYFDFEQWASPLDSYAITSRSGLLPKLNWPLFYHWQIPLIFLGVYLYFKSKLKINYVKQIFIISFLGFLLLNKRDILTHQILLIPYISIITSLGIRHLYNLKKIIFRNVILIVFLTFIALQTFQTAYIFSNKQSDFRYTHEYAFYLNSILYEKYSSEYDNFVITNRYGDTQKAFDFYVKNYNKNINFNKFNNDQLEPSVLYIGLSSEFEISLDKKSDRRKFEIIEKHVLWDPPVSNYGNELWVGYKK